MSQHQPTITDDRDDDGGIGGASGGHADALDADMLPEEFPDDRPLASRDYGTTEAEQARRESLDRRLRREEPDQVAGLDDDINTSDDSDDADDESPELMGVEDEDGGDTVKELATVRGMPDRHTDDSGQPRSPRSAEEDAVHVVDRDADFDDDDDEDATAPADRTG